MNKNKQISIGLMMMAASLGIPAYAQNDSLRTQAGDTIHLTLDQAIKVAMDQNPTIVVDSMEVQKTNYAQKENLGNLYPSLNLVGSYSHTIEKQKMQMMGKEFEVGSSENWAFGFQAGMPLINAPLWASLKLTEESINAKRESARQTKINMVSTITEAYYQLLNAKDSYKVLKESYSTANENLRITRKRFEQGMTSEYDTIQTSVQVKQIEPNMISAKNGIDLATLQLKILMGMPDQYPITVDGSLEDYEKTMFDDVKLSDIDTTLSDNSTVRQLEVNTRLLEKQLKMTKMQWYPTLSLSFMYEWMAMSDDLKMADYTWNPYSTVGITLNFPIFQGGKRYYKQKEDEVAYNEMKFTMDDTKRQLKLGLQANINSLRVAIQTIDATKAAVKSAEKGLEISKKRYEVGAGTTLELTNAQTSVTQAKLSYLQAIYNYITAKDAVDKVLGNAYKSYVQ